MLSRRAADASPRRRTVRMGSKAASRRDARARGRARDSSRGTTRARSRRLRPSSSSRRRRDRRRAGQPRAPHRRTRTTRACWGNVPTSSAVPTREPRSREPRQGFVSRGSRAEATSASPWWLENTDNALESAARARLWRHDRRSRAPRLCSKTREVLVNFQRAFNERFKKMHSFAARSRARDHAAHALLASWRHHPQSARVHVSIGSFASPGCFPPPQTTRSACSANGSA